jgi:hypothetical protein
MDNNVGDLRQIFDSSLKRTGLFTILLKIV